MMEHNHEELRRLFDLAIAAPADQRAALLNRECAGDDPLRERVLAMIAAAEDDRFLASPTMNEPLSADSMATMDTSAPGGEGSAAPLREGPGARIGPYKLLQVIGEGGFGTVFMAEQEKPVARRVALKIIKLGMDTRQVIARFEAERQALAMMDHHNIARVLDAGATETGRPYFVMELVKGDPITQYCDRNNLTITDRLELFAQVCQAVQHAHQKGIIHRDIKPSNILVNTQDGRPFAKVIDFGIAKATASKLTEKTLFTEHRQFIGTPEYMSPEQAAGGLDVDTRTDVYSLGVLMYELLTGTTPFDGTDLRSAAFGEVQRIIREVDPPKPSTRISRSTDSLAGVASRRRTEPRKLGTVVRGELDWIVMKALDKDRQRRYETANGLASDVRRYIAGQTVSAAPPSSAYALRKLVRRNKGVVAAGAAVSAALVLGVIGFAWQASIAGRQRDAAVAAKSAEVLQRRLAYEQRDRAMAAEAEASKRASELSAVSEFQARMLGQIDATEAGEKLMAGIRAKFGAAIAKDGISPADRTARAEVFEQELARVNATDTATALIDATILEPAIRAIDTQFKDQPVVDANLRGTIAELYRNLGLYEQALTLQNEALAIARRVQGGDHKDTLKYVNDVASTLESLGRMSEAETNYLEAFEGRKRTLGEDDHDTVNSMGNLGNFYRSQARFAEAEPLLRGALERSRRVLGNEHRDTLIAMNTMGFLYVSQGKYAEAEPLWREAYETGRRVLPQDDRDVLVWINNLGGLLQAQGKMDEAEPLFRETLERHRRVLGEEHPSTIRVIGVMGSHLIKRGKYAEAEPLFREALEKSRRVLGTDHPYTLSSRNDMGNFLMQRGRLAEAEPYLRDSLEVRRRTQGEDHPDTLVARSQVAKLLMMQDRLAESEAAYRQVLESSRRVLGSEHPDTLILINNLGSLLLQAGKPDDAEPFIREALETCRRISGEDHPETLVVLINSAMVAEKQGHLPQAETIYRDAAERCRRVLGDDHPTTLNGLTFLASMLRSEGKREESESLYREAVAGYERRAGKEHVRTAGARLGLGKTLTDLGRFAQAEGELLEAERVYSIAQGVPLSRRNQSIEAIVALYNAWNAAEPGKGYEAKAAEWKARTLNAEPAR